MTLAIRTRLTLWYGSLLAAALIIFAGAVYLIMAGALMRNLDTSLHDRITHLSSSIEVNHEQLVFPRAEEQTDEPLIPDVLLKPSGQVFVGHIPAALQPHLTPVLLPHERTIEYGSAGNLRYAVSPIIRGGKIAGYLAAWQSLTPVDDARHSLLRVLLAAGPLLLLAASVGGYVLARRALRPVRNVTRVASAISTTDLRARVPVRPTRDELSELAATFNEMIGRLHSGVERERRFAADASHELRSPLAVIRAEATLALDKPRTETEYRRVLNVIDEQAAAMEDLVGGLLLLARAETLQSHEYDPVSLDLVIESAIALCLPAMKARQVLVETEIEGGLRTRGSRALLTRAVRNLVDNAVKVARPGETVTVRACRRGSDAVIVDVEDRGPGISSDDLRHLFTPFFQTSTARTPGDSHGLGLAICHRIVTAHGGDVTVDSIVGKGTSFHIRLPRIEDEARSPRRSGGTHVRPAAGSAP